MNNERITSDFYEVAAIEELTGYKFTDCHIISHGGRNQAVVTYDNDSDLPKPDELKVVWERDGEILARCDLLPCGDGSFERTYVLRKKEMLDKLDGRNK